MYKKEGYWDVKTKIKSRETADRQQQKFIKQL